MRSMQLARTPIHCPLMNGIGATGIHWAPGGGTTCAREVTGFHSEIPTGYCECLSGYTEELTELGWDSATEPVCQIKKMKTNKDPQNTIYGKENKRN